ncbi:MAG: amidohydrolase [Deltaproteobacteria bacterium]|nr:amidohydrolase [Deltaproteobacteria bacterium]
MRGMFVIDADGHLLETDELLRRHLEEPYNNRPRLFPRDWWDRSMGGRLGKEVFDVETRLKDMDVEGIDVSVLFPTSGLSIGLVKEVGFAVALARAYNNLVAEVCSRSPRLKAVALVPPQNLSEAVKEANRAVTGLGLVGVMLPAHGHMRNLGGPEFYPLYEECQRLKVPVTIHANSYGTEGTDRFDNFLATHIVSFPMEMLIQLTGVILGGIPELFPQLKMGFLEFGCGWLPYWIDRMDGEYEKRSSEAPLLKKTPGEYMLGGTIFYSVEPEESTIPYVVERCGADVLLYASDYPHWDMDYPESAEDIRKRATLSDEVKRKILGENAKRFYNLK